MSTPASALPAAPQAANVPEAPKTAIQIIEADLFNFFKQKEQAIANVHAIDGAIQSTQLLLQKLKAEAVKAEVWAKAEAEKVKLEAEKVVVAVETEAKKL